MADLDKMETYLNIGIKSHFSEIAYLQFGVASPTEISEISVCEVTSTCLRSTSKNESLRGSVYDPRMGVIGNNGECATCGNNSIVCPGHFGHIVLEEPIMHPKFFKTIVSIIKCVCESCSACLIPREQAKLCGLLKYKTYNRLKQMVEKCSKIKSCPACDEPCPTYVVKENKNVKKYYGNKEKISEVSTREIYNICLKISNDDFNLLGFNQNLPEGIAFTKESALIDEDMVHRHQTRPEWMIFMVLPVLPPCDRPYSSRDGEKNDDDLTDKYVSIVKANQKLREDREAQTIASEPITKGRRRGGKLKEADRKKIIADLEEHIRTLIDNSDEKSKISGGRPHKGLKERMTSKEGQVRKNIMGKRCNFSGRTVIDGDPTLELDQVGLPEQIARILTKPEYVTAANIERMQEFITKNKVNFVFRRGEQIILRDPTGKWTPSKSSKEFQLQPADVIERELQDDDWILMNRQPTLRIESMMGFRIKIMPGKSLRLNLSVTTPFNAD